MAAKRPTAEQVADAKAKLLELLTGRPVDHAGDAIVTVIAELDAVAAEVVALREAVYEAGREHNYNRRGSDGPCECDSCRANTELLTDPSPAVAEIERLVGRLQSGLPNVVCLCGSTRFPDAWKTHYRLESLKGYIVLAVGVMVWAGDEPIRDNSPIKSMLDELHKRKIDLADEVLVLNVGGYIGDSTRSEIEYAVVRGKPVRYLEAIGGER